MDKQSYIESDIEFTFGEGWIVKKYDNHPYFKMLSGRGLKGVDFIGIYKNESLFLIEVKNYHKRSYSPVGPDGSNIEGDEPTLGRQFHGKIEDSLRLIRVVNKYLSTRWWFSIASRLRQAFKTDSIKKDWHFWTKAGKLSEDLENVHPILWLEIGPELFKPSGEKSLDLINALKREYAKGKFLPTKPILITSIKTQFKEGILKNIEASRNE